MRSYLLMFCLLGILARVAAAQTTVTILVADGSAAETLAGQPENPGLIRITRTGATSAPLTVWVKVAGNAIQGTDYTFGNAIGSFVVIPVGSSSLDIPIRVRDDAFTEADEEIRIDLEDETNSGAAVPYRIGADRAEVRIQDNEDPSLPPRAVVRVASLGAQMLESLSNAVSFRVFREGNLSVPLEVLYTLGGSATPGADYQVSADRVIIPAGATFGDLTLVAINDTLIETSESVILTLMPHPRGGEVPPPVDAYALGQVTSGTMNLISEDLPPPPAVTITSPVAGSSQAAPGTIQVAVSAVDPLGHIVRFVLTDGPTVIASNGVTHVTPPLPGTPFEFTTTLTNVRAGLHSFRARAWSNSGQMGSSSVVQSIVTNIPPIISKMSVEALDAEAAEGPMGGPSNPAAFAITVDVPMPTDQYVVYRLTSPGPGLDFHPPAGYSQTNWPMYWPIGPTDYGYAFFPKGTTRVVIEVEPVEDAMQEGNEALTLTLSYPFVFTERTFEGIVQFTEGGFHTPPFDPYALPVRYFDYDLTTNSVATATLLDNDTEPTPFAVVAIAATDSDAEETAPGAGVANVGVFTISRVGPTDLPLSVNYQLTARPRDIPLRFPIPVQAQHGIDYVVLPSLGVATIPAGATSTDIVIAPIHDLVTESPEYVQIHLRPSSIPVPSSSSYLLYTNSMASLVIRDFVLPALTPVVYIKTADSQAIENESFNRTASFTVQRVGNLAESLTVPYSLGGTALHGVDYEEMSGVVTIPAGSARSTILIKAIADGVAEPTESISVSLARPPSDVYPPPYVLSGSSTLRSSAGASIRDSFLTPGQPLTRRMKVLLWRHNRYHRHVVVPLPAPSLQEESVASQPITWAVDASSDLVLWEEIGTTQDPEEFVDVSEGDHAERFYRFRELSSEDP
ncbi:MAG: hypothetical protein JNN07_25190 [Verrucomicrobiales bacterium]|nr:hypothetical protein [Verrucomicrobiales bacterium]